MRVNPAPPWIADLPRGDALTADVSCDVAVVGGGWPGLVAAQALAAGGARTVLLEARGQLGAGTSGRAPGMLVEGLVEHPWRLASALGDETASAIHRLTRQGRAFLAHEARGSLWCAVQEREHTEIARSVQTLTDWQVPVQMCSAEESMESTGASHLLGSWLTASDAVVDPARTTRELVDAARGAGVSLFGNAKVDAIVQGEGVTLRAGGRRIQAEMVLMAAETGLPELDPWFAEMMSPIREQALLLDAVVDMPILRTGYGYTQWVPTAHGLVVAGCRFATPHMEVGETDDTVVTPAIQERLEASVSRFFPELDAKVVARWSWITARSCDGLPLIGPFPGSPRVVVCAGFGGLEGTLGVAAGLAVSRGILTGSSGLPDRLSPMRLVA